MIKNILIRTTGSDGDNPIFSAGLAIARMFDAHMAFLHVSIDPVQAVQIAAASIDTGGAPLMTGDWLERLETESQVQQDNARRAVEAFCDREGVPIRPSFDPNRLSASWHGERGRESEWLPAYGREAELIVIGREASEVGSLGAALFESGRPLLIPGTRGMTSPPETAVIAWKPTREAARAVSAATPILEKCKRVVVLTATVNAEDDTGSVDRLVVALRRHGLSVEAEKLRLAKSGDADNVLDAARNLPSPLLVMGGYGHSRVREMVFGGFTKRVLGGADIPVLMAH